MPIRVRCSKCQTSYDLADKLAGKKIRCKKCEGVIPVPDVDTEDSEEVAAPPVKKGKTVQSKRQPDPVGDEDDEPRPKRRRDEEDGEEEPPSRNKKSRPAKKKLPLAWIIGGGVGGVVVIAAIVTGVIMTRGGPNKPAETRNTGNGAIQPQNPAEKVKSGDGKDKTTAKEGEEPIILSETLFRLQRKGSSDSPLALSPAGKWVAVAETDSTILLDAATGKQLASCPNASAPIAPRKLLFTPDNKSLLIVPGFGRMKKLSVPDGTAEDGPDQGNVFPVFLTFTKDGRLLGLYDTNEKAEMIVKDLSADKVLARMRMPRAPIDYRFGGISPDGTSGVAIENSVNVVLVQWAPKPSVKRLEAFPDVFVHGSPGGTAGCPESDFIAVASSGGRKNVARITLWDVNSGTKKDSWPLTGETAGNLVMSQDGRWLAASVDTSKDVCIWNVAAKRKAVILKGMARGGGALAFSADLSRLAALEVAGGSLHVWDLTKASLAKPPQK